MGNDNGGCLAGWPKAKKSKKAEPEDAHNWAHLPSLVLNHIFSFLTHKDRANASSACRNWRQALYHPNFWHDVKFTIEPTNIAKSQYMTGNIAHIVRNATIKFDSLSSSCVSELITLLQCLSTNSNLRSLLLQPTHCRIEQHYKFFINIRKEGSNSLLTRLVQTCCRIPLQRFTIGGCEDLSQHIPQFLQLLAGSHPEKVTLLGLASVKDDPGNYLICDTDPALFTSFTKLKILSIDYDILSDVFLDALEDIEDLERLVVHVHGVWPGHPGTSENAWIRFKDVHLKCELRMSFIHAYDEISHMHESILRCNMPLSHLKVFFCENINIEALNFLSTWYTNTLRSIVWVDSHNAEPESSAWSLVRRFGLPDGNLTDPLVMAAWLCPKLEEVVLLGYKYFEEDLVAIPRLRNDTLKNLEVALDDVVSSSGTYRGLSDMKCEISKVIGKPWAPLKKSELHPVITDPTAGDSDEYLLPKVLADLY